MGIVEVRGVDADQPGVAVIGVAAEAAQVGDVGVRRVDGQGKIHVAEATPLVRVGDRVWIGVAVDSGRLGRDGLVVVGSRIGGRLGSWTWVQFSPKSLVMNRPSKPPARGGDGRVEPARVDLRSRA